MGLGVSTLLPAVESHVLKLGRFDRVNRHEPKKAPGKGLTAAIWVDAVDPIPEASGLNTTSARFGFMVRAYTSMLAEPQDQVDPNLVEAVDLLMAAYSGDFTLGGLIRSVDLLGAHGVPLSFRAGYLEQDNRMFRVIDITLPVIVNDAWNQEA